MIEILLSIFNILLILVIAGMIVWWFMYGQCEKCKPSSEEGSGTRSEESSAKTLDPYEKINGVYEIMQLKGPKLREPIEFVIQFTPDKEFIAITPRVIRTGDMARGTRAKLANDINAPRVLFYGQGPSGKFENETSIYFENSKFYFTDVGTVIQKKKT